MRLKNTYLDCRVYRGGLHLFQICKVLTSKILR
jgi:hypothetical protein